MPVHFLLAVANGTQMDKIGFGHNYFLYKLSFTNLSWIVIDT